MRMFASDRVASIMERLKWPDDEAIQAKMVSRAVENAQRQIEELNYERRKNVLKYDDVMNAQRAAIYGQRREILEGRDLKEQALDLEALANHRGSVLGLTPGDAQPGQKRFETLVWDTLRRFDAARPVWIESESKKVGDLHVPPALIQHMRASPCLNLELALPARVTLLLQDYQHFVDDTATFCERLDALRVLRGNDVVDAWQADVRTGHIESVVHDLLVAHYDPIYLQSMRRNFAGFSAPRLSVSWDGSEPGLQAAARALVGAARVPTECHAKAARRHLRGGGSLRGLSNLFRVKRRGGGLAFSRPCGNAWPCRIVSPRCA